MTKEKNKLNNCRKEIDRIDRKIFKLLMNRFILVKKIGKYKKANGIKIFNKKREKYILDEIKSSSRKHGTDEKYTENIFRSIIKNSRKIQ